MGSVALARVWRVWSFGCRMSWCHRDVGFNRVCACDRYSLMGCLDLCECILNGSGHNCLLELRSKIIRLYIFATFASHIIIWYD